MNKKGFTLVELLAVLVLIILIMLLVIPNLKNLFSSNSKKQYESYEDMMVEYTKTYPGYEDYEHICLEDLGIDKFNKNISCNGFVRIEGSKITPYLSCINENHKELYKTNNYDVDTPLCFGIIDNSLKVITTINNTETLYKSGTWISGDNYVNLKFKTLSNLGIVNVLKDENIVNSCELLKKENLYNCDISIHESGMYESYGILNEKKLYSNSINILIDKNSPTFDIYDSDNNILNDEIVMEIKTPTIDINNIVKNISDLESGIKSIRYSFEKESDDLNFINVSEGDSFTINKTIELGKYKLVIEVIDNVENKTEKVINYQINEKGPDLVSYTVIHKQMNNDGASYSTVKEEKLTGEVGMVVTPNINTYSNFISPAKQTMTLSDNPDNNIITYLYKRTCFGETCKQCTKGDKIGTCMYNQRTALGLWSSGLSLDSSHQNVRFIGTKSKSPNNWVCFGTKTNCTNSKFLYRMVGVFETEHRVRLISNVEFGPKNWRTKTYEYNSPPLAYTHSNIKSDVDAILTNSTYGYTTVINGSTKWSDIIVNTQRDSHAGSAAYTYNANKVLTRDYRGGERSYSAKLHLTSPADILLASGSTSLTFPSNYNTIAQTWIYPTKPEWSYEIWNTANVYVYDTAGRLCGNGTEGCSVGTYLGTAITNYYRVTFELNKNTLFCGGSGTKTDPIILGYSSCTN